LKKKFFFGFVELCWSQKVAICYLFSVLGDKIYFFRFLVLSYPKTRLEPEKKFSSALLNSVGAGDGGFGSHAG